MCLGTRLKLICLDVFEVALSASGGHLIDSLLPHAPTKGSGKVALQ